MSPSEHDPFETEPRFGAPRDWLRTPESLEHEEHAARSSHARAPNAPLHRVLEGPLVDVAFFVVLCTVALASGLVALFCLVERALPGELAQLSTSDPTVSAPPPPAWIALVAAIVCAFCAGGILAFSSWSQLRTDAGGTAARLLRVFAWSAAAAGLGTVLALGVLLTWTAGLQPMFAAGQPDVVHCLLAVAGVGPILFAAYALYALPGYLRSLAAPVSDENEFTLAESV